MRLGKRRIVSGGRASKRKGRFGDTLVVRTARSGTQYVRPLDVMFSEDELLHLARKARRSVQRQVDLER